MPPSALPSKHSILETSGSRLHKREKVDPRRAIALYQGLASGQIAGKNRSAYIQAVEYLQRVKKLYRKLGEDGAWSEYLAKLRNAHPTLRAFQEELSRL